MTRMQRRSPLKCVGSPRIQGCHTASVHGIEEVEQEDQLSSKCYDSRSRHKHVQICIHIGKLKVCPSVVPSWEPGNSDIVHREKHHVHADKCQPEMHIP